MLEGKLEFICRHNWGRLSLSQLTNKDYQIVCSNVYHVKAFNYELTKTFMSAYLNHKILSEGLDWNDDLNEVAIYFGERGPTMFIPDTPGVLNQFVQIPDLTLSWIKYFKELEEILDCFVERCKNKAYLVENV